MKQSPGEAAGLRLGDLIVKINGTSINQVHRVAELSEKAGNDKKPLEVTYKRDGQLNKTLLNPVFDAEDQGMAIRLVYS